MVEINNEKIGLLETDSVSFMSYHVDCAVLLTKIKILERSFKSNEHILKEHILSFGYLSPISGKSQRKLYRLYGNFLILTKQSIKKLICIKKGLNDLKKKTNI